MKTNQMLALAAALLTLFAACKKEETTTPAPTPTPVEKNCVVTKGTSLDTLNGTPSMYVSNYEFDNLNRLVKVKFLNGAITENTTTVSYATNTVTVNRLYATSSDYSKQTATLNSAGNATVIYYEYYDPTNGITRDTARYEYDTNNYLTKKIDQYGTKVYTYSNGDLASTIRTSKTGDVTTLQYEYYTDKSMKTELFIPLIKIGKLDIHLFKSRVYNGTNGTSKYEAKYEFNSDGYPTKEIGLSTSTSGSKDRFTYFYEYTCK